MESWRRFVQGYTSKMYCTKVVTEGNGILNENITPITIISKRKVSHTPILFPTAVVSLFLRLISLCVNESTTCSQNFIWGRKERARFPPPPMHPPPNTHGHSRRRCHRINQYLSVYHRERSACINQLPLQR